MKTLVVDDDRDLAEFLVRVLTEEGDEAEMAGSLREARQRLADGVFDVIILDWMLPDGDGVELCGELSGRPSAPPVLMLTARGEVADRVRGLRSGADDYLIKPFEVDELLARLGALARRAKSSGEQRVGPLSIQRLSQRAWLDGAPLDLRGKEFALLARLAEQPDRPVDRAALLAEVWGLKFDPGSGVLEVHVSRLRDRLGDEAWRVETVRGVGYRLRRER